MATRVDYRVYPSLLIAFQRLLDYELVAEEDWNKVSEACHERGEYTDRDVGDYKLSPDEMYLKLEADLIDMINRVEGEYGEAADKGTAFNEIVDCLIEHRRSLRDDCRIYSTTNAGGMRVIRAEIHDFTFDYDIPLCRETAGFFAGSVTQFLAEAQMETSFGLVQLYGYVDEWVGCEMYDIKTTGRYSWGKFEHGWQRHVYPWCVMESGLATRIDRFVYYVVEWAYQRKGEPLKAKGVYLESYDYDHAESGRKIRQMLELFLGWLHARKRFIHDRRIFGGENPAGWRGEPVDMAELEEFIFGNDLKIA